MVENDENTILEQAIGGDGEAFGVLYERYIARIYNYIYYRVGNVSEAEDLTERVFLRALHHIGGYRQKGLPFSAWLYRIAHNLVANWHRDSGRRKDIPLDEGSLVSQQFNSPEQALLKAEEKSRLLQAIARLPANRQELLILKFVDGLSNAEIGSVLGRTEGAIKSLYHRTLESIRDELAEFMIIPAEIAEENRPEVSSTSIMEEWLEPEANEDRY